MRALLFQGMGLTVGFGLTNAQRQKLLYVPERNFRVAERLIQSSRYLEEPLATAPEILGHLGMWKGECIFAKDGARFKLTFRESHEKISQHEIQRVFRYDFREIGSESEIFRFDTHGRPVAHTSACHCHLGGGEGVRHQEGDRCLKGFSMVSLTLCDVLDIINGFLEEGKLPWS